MARKRMIDPTIWADEDFGNLSSDAKVMFIGIISSADDEGRLPGNPMYLSSTIFPYVVISNDRATKIRDEVITHMKSVKLYTIEGKEYIQLLNWDNYQSINRPTKSKYPPLTEDSLSIHGGLTPNRIEKNRIEKNRIEKNIGNKKNSKNSHTPCTKEELQTIADELQVDFADVESVHETILTKIEEKTFSYKTIYRTLHNWVKRNRDKGWIKKKEPEKVGMAGFNYKSLEGMRL